MAKLYLIDGHSLAYRAFFALPSTMTNRNGLHTNAIYGFAAILLNLLQSERPDYIAVAFDLKTPTFRHLMYPDYKGHRPPAPPEFVEQIPYIKKTVEYFSIKYFELAGYEADDILGTLASQTQEKQLQTVIVTGDLDALQLVSDHIKIMTTRKGISDTVLYDEAEVMTRYGLSPDQIVDLKSLKGDASDNIPGVPGIGEKTALKLLHEYQTLDNILQHISQITPTGLREKLSANVDKARLSYTLAKINRSVPIKVELSELKTCFPGEELKSFFVEMQFSSLIAKLGLSATVPSLRKVQGDYRVVDTPEQLATVSTQLLHEKEFAFDVETTSTDSTNTTIVGLSVCSREGAAWYFPFPVSCAPPELAVQQSLFSAEPTPSVYKTVPLDDLIVFFRKLMSTASLKIGQNIKFDINVLRSIGIPVLGPFFDTMVADYLLDPIRSKHNLKFLSEYYLGLQMTNITELIGSGKDQTTMDKIPIDLVAPYCCADADITLRLKNLLLPKLEAAHLLDYYGTFEAPLIKILSDMECAGIKLDTYYLQDLSAIITHQIEQEEQYIHQLAGQKFNINSSLQTSQILFDKLNLQQGKKTKTGHSTDIEVLQSLAGQHEIAARIIAYRQLTKLKNTYIQTLPTLINPATGRLHTTFNQAITATGRLSSTNPNLQNIPIKTEMGSRIRKAFTPQAENHVLLSIDYSQMELRILASLSADPLLCQAFRNGEDIHTATAAILYEVSPEQVTADMRRKAKTINFGIIYGMGPKGLSDALHISLLEASQFIKNYFSKYPGIKTFIDVTINSAIDTGYVTTYYGRKRPIPELTTAASKGKNAGKRIAVNSVIQGTAADIVKLKMIRLDAHLDKLDYFARILLQVHDELVIEVDKRFISEFSILIQTEMEALPEFAVPFTTNITYGNNWQEAK